MLQVTGFDRTNPSTPRTSRHHRCRLPDFCIVRPLPKHLKEAGVTVKPYEAFLPELRSLQPEPLAPSVGPTPAAAPLVRYYCMPCWDLYQIVLGHEDGAICCCQEHCRGGEGGEDVVFVELADSRKGYFQHMS